MLTELEQTFLNYSLRWAKLHLRPWMEQCQVYGLRPRHLVETRLDSVEPVYHTSKGIKYLKGFVISILRHPNQSVLKQKWNVSIWGNVSIIENDGMVVKKKKQLGRYMHSTCGRSLDNS